VAAQCQVVGQFAADQAGAHDEHPARCVPQRGAQALVGLQVVDTPAQRGRQPRGQGSARAMGQHQVLVAQRPARGAQGAAVRRGVDAHGMGVCQQPQVQARRRGGAGLAHQALGGQVLGHGDGQLRLVVQIAAAVGHQGDGALRVQRAQGFGHQPACTAGAHDDNAWPGVARGGGYNCRAAECLGFQCLHAGRQVRLEIGLGHAAQRAGPVVGYVGETGAGRQATVGVALCLVVEVAAGVADVLQPGVVGQRGVGDGGSAHAGISSVDRRAISLRKCLMAGVTMATKCDSRTRRCTSELMR